MPLHEPFLYQHLDSVSAMGLLNEEVPHSIRQNISPNFELRPYQENAFGRFFHCYNNKFPGKNHPIHFLFNMATGSGKTLIMAGLILYLYEEGYRNFLFFVHSTNIIEKTKDNFLNTQSIKYLFAKNIHIKNHHVNITPVDNFEAVNPNDINICFTTIQKLHSDLTTEKENALTFEDFRKHKIVLLADEAHHINVKTKAQKEMFESWENTIERIFAENENNLLLEFTATHDYENEAMREKYLHKIIVRYDLLHFRNDKYSKDVVIVQSDFDLNERILQALILSQYKQAVAAKYRINLKPVILFKAQRTIAQSEENKENFHHLIENLNEEAIANIRNNSTLPRIARAFKFFHAENITDAQIVERLKNDFQEEYCLSVNSKDERVNHQILVNTLEDKNNRIRAIFAVQKLNEGWDVLNLFDIVRCYEKRDSGRQKIGKTTISEAQLIGRGARYFPFVLPESSDRFRRKFDLDLDHELRIIEELHYHSINDSRYISEIRQALINEGMLDEKEVTRQLKLKEPFKKTDFYKYGVIWLNERKEKSYQRIKSFEDLGVKRRNYVHTIATGQGKAEIAMSRSGQGRSVKDENRKDLRVQEVEKNIIQAALSRNPFYQFSALKRYFPHLGSMRNFIQSENYLGGLEITFQGDVYNLDANRAEKFRAVIGLLNQVESEIRQEITDYEGTRKFKRDRVHKIFTDKTLKFDPHNQRGDKDAQFEHFVSDRDWFSYDSLYGTSEEKSFVRMLDRQMGKLGEEYEEIYLLRNESHFSIYNFDDGRAFQPDFVLFLREKSGELLVYQLFIEPKGRHIKEHDIWKEDFLKEITTQYERKILNFDDKKYRLIGVPFYNAKDENEFREGLEEVLN